MQLKLADYGEKKEKFERFLINNFQPFCHELKFAYAGDFIAVNESFERLNPSCPRVNDYLYWYKKDEKDPLNRFDGLFNGRTYGKGRFVLIKDDADDIYKFIFPYRGSYAIKFEIREAKFFLGRDRIKALKTWETAKEAELYGNLHENPELYSKL